MRADETPLLELPPGDSVIGTHVGEYRVEKKLGEGGMASVFAAIHPLIGKRAAIKVMAPALCADAQAVMRFVQEARAVNQIGHPNIVDVFSFGRLPDGRSYFVMEWLAGESLFERMTARKLSLDEVIDIVDQICDALEAAHEKGIIHRDIKPANIFLQPVRGRADQVKLLDFGVAKLSALELKLSHTRTGFVVGTPDYISPEQARSKDVDHRTDIYALGAVLFEMVLGRLPFEADNPMDMVRLHMTDPAPLPSTLWPQIPTLLDRLIVSMLEKDPAQRPSLPEVRAALRKLRDEPRPTLPPRLGRRKRIDARRVQVLAGGAALAIGLGLLVVSALHGQAPATHARGAATEAAAGSAPEMAKLAPARPEAPPPVVEAPALRHDGEHAKKSHRKKIARPDGDYLVDPFDPRQR